MKQSIVIGLFLGTIKANCPSPLFGANGECTQFDDTLCAKESEVDGKAQTAETKAALAKTLEDFFTPITDKCAVVGGKNLKATCPNDNEIDWAEYTDTDCSQGQTNDQQLKMDVCGKVDDKNVICKNGASPTPTPPGPGATCTSPVVKQCVKYDDKECTTASKGDGGGPQTDEEKATFASKLNTFIMPAFNKCAKLGTNYVHGECPTGDLFAWTDYGTEKDDCTGTKGVTTTYKEETCFVSPEDGTTNFKCSATAPGPAGSCPTDGTIFEYCVKYDDDECKTMSKTDGKDQTLDDAKAQAVTANGVLKPILDKCDTGEFEGKKNVQGKCDSATKPTEVTWTVYSDDKCATAATPADTGMIKKDTCGKLAGMNWICDGPKPPSPTPPDVTPGPTPPVPGNEVKPVAPASGNATNNSDDDGASAVGATIAAATLGVAATLF